MHMKLHPMFANVYCIHDNNSQYMLSVPVMACTFQTHLRHRTQLPKFRFFLMLSRGLAKPLRHAEKEHGYQRAAGPFSEI